MKILLTGGGSGGHFYPIIAVAEQIRTIAKEMRLVPPHLTFMAPEQYDAEALFEHDIAFAPVTAGKRRRYVSIKNFFDLFKTGWGIIIAVVKVFFLFPDVIFGKGGYASFPALLAGRAFGIPIVIHESDVVPGKVNAWAARFAQRIAISFPETADLLSKETAEKVALTGNPVRKDLHTAAATGAAAFLKLEESTPVILILGGSQGAQHINEAVLEILPQLVEKYQIIHQVGKENLAEITETAGVLLDKNIHAARYKPFDFLNVVGLRMAAGAADLIITRGGGGAVFEVALWGKPSIFIPISSQLSDQPKNAFAFARAGACIVIEENNLTPNVLLSEIDRLMNDPARRAEMGNAARAFAQPDAAAKIAREIIDIALEHER